MGDSFGFVNCAGRWNGPVVLKLLKSNSAALIIGASIIVALNFERFVDWTRYGYYHLSGQAAADARERQQYYENEMAGQAKAEREQQAAAEQRQADENERLKLVEAVNTAWQNFLIANRSKFKQIEIVRDTAHGDYACLEIIYGPMANLLIEEWKPEVKKARDQMAAQWTYEVRDQLADAFVQWLNANRVWGVVEWRYDTLKDITKYRYGGSLPLFQECLFPADVWRANRYQRKID
jgi:hypothetical protein